MGSLEDLAKTLFQRYSQYNHNISARWEYLNKDRQLAWMEEVYMYTTFVVEELKKDVKPVPTNDPRNTSYSMGFMDGIRAERTFFIGLLEALSKELIEELKEKANGSKE